MDSLEQQVVTIPGKEANLRIQVVKVLSEGILTDGGCDDVGETEEQAVAGPRRQMPRDGRIPQNH